MIRNFFIMNSHGNILYSHEYSEAYTPDLLASFISAIHSFMEQSIYTGELDAIEVGGLRFIFNLQHIGTDESKIFFIVLCDRTDNIASIKPKLQKVSLKFLELFYNDIKKFAATGERSLFEPFKEYEQPIFTEKLIEISPEVEGEILGVIDSLYNKTEFIIGAALLTQMGNVLLSFIEDHLLENILRTLEGRFHSGFRSIDTILSREKDGILVLIGSEKIVCAVLFKSNCPFTSALEIGESFNEEINKLLAQRFLN